MINSDELSKVSKDQILTMTGKEEWFALVINGPPVHDFGKIRCRHCLTGFIHRDRPCKVIPITKPLEVLAFELLMPYRNVEYVDTMPLWEPCVMIDKTVLLRDGTYNPDHCLRWLCFTAAINKIKAALLAERKKHD